MSLDTAEPLPESEPSYEVWLDAIFDHPVLDPAWHWQDDSDDLWFVAPRTTLSYLTRLFSDPLPLRTRFTGGQIDQALNFIISSSCSNISHELTNVELPLTDRLACIRAMAPLYSKLMAPVYGDTLGHLAKKPLPEGIPGFACYMWWDVIPLYGGMPHPDRDAINDAVLEVLQEVLRLDAESCLESALHGLGHWHLYMPERTAPIVHHFLRRTDISDQLRAYAELAACGGVQ